MDNPDGLFTVGILREKIKGLPDEMIVATEIWDGSQLEIHGVEAKVEEYKNYPNEGDCRKVLVIAP